MTSAQMHYYKNYGLAIRGLQHHHPEFDATDFDRKCDGALPLEDLLHNGQFNYVLWSLMLV